MEPALENTQLVGTVQVKTTDTQELINLTDALQDLSARLDRIGGIVVKQYQLTERLESLMRSLEFPSVEPMKLDASVVEWINKKIAKKIRKEEEKKEKKNRKKNKW